MDRLARNLDDLRKIVKTITEKGARIEFSKENLIFTGDDSPMATLLLSVMGAFAEFERSLIRERQREGVAIAKAKGLYRGRKPKLNSTQIEEAKTKIALGVSKARVAREMGITRMTLYNSIGK
jgi:DNA invertase Pin-like site-specific DNA recombinase